MPGTRPHRPPRSRVAFPALALAVLALAGCAAGVPEPVLEPFVDAAKTPVVLVPGVTGSELHRRDDGEPVWGTGARVLAPRDGGYALARPLDLPRGAATKLAAGGVIERLRVLGVIEKAVYGPIPDMLERHGYTRGDARRPRPDDDLFLFAYDWRADNLVTVHRLDERLTAIARARGATLRRPSAVDLVCQSGGAHVCRYLAKYGAVSLDEAEAALRDGLAPPRRPYAVRKLILAGTSNGGSLRILRELHRGRRYAAPFGRRILPEVLFTFPALFQDLPAYRPRPFVDGTGRHLDVDLFDPEVWIRRGWSIFDPEARRRADRRPDLFGDAGQRADFLRRALERARRLHRLLARDAPGFGATRYYLLQNAYEPTPDLAVLGADGSSPLFTGDDALAERPYLAALASAPGDGHATLESQLALSPQERDALAAPPFLVRGGHFELILDPGARRRLLDFLADGGADRRP